MMKKIKYAAAALAAALCCSCQQTAVGGVPAGVRNYSDAVVHIGQVDPAYRDYFRSQNAANYSLGEQRKAYLAAAQVARTPVRASDYRPGDIRSVAKKKVAANKGKSKSIAATKKRSSNTVKKGAVAVRKPRPYRR